MMSSNLIAGTSKLVDEVSSFCVSLKLIYVNQNGNWILHCIYKADLT